MKVEIEVDGLRAGIQDGKWQGDAALIPRVLDADAKAGFAWDPIGGMDYAIAQAVAAALGGTVLTPLPKIRSRKKGNDENVIY